MKNKNTMSAPILSVKGLSHMYNASYAIHDINMEINFTGIMGLLGSNGAGKSTTMNIMCGVLTPTSGNVFIDGISMLDEPERCKMKLGFLPQNAPLYLDFSVDDYLIYCAHLRMMNKKDIALAVEKVKERCGIAHFSNRLIKNLSGGYRQRVGIAQAIIHEPRVVVLDEPTNGLDPNQILQVRHLIREIAEERAVIFSSHILSEIQVLCDDITMIENGKIVFADSMHAFNNYIKPHSLLIRLASPPAADVLKSVPGVTKVEPMGEDSFKIYFDNQAEISDNLIHQSIEQKWSLQEITFDKTSVEEVFAQLSNKKDI